MPRGTASAPSQGSLVPLQAQLAGLQAQVACRIERQVALSGGIIQIEGIADARRVVSLRSELLLAQLEAAGDLQRADDAQEHRSRVGWQLPAERAAQLRRIEAVFDHHGGHAGAAVAA